MTIALLGLSPLGIIHTAISLIAVGAGIYAFVRDKAILPTNLVGKVYVITTILTCLTGFGIFQEGRFTQAHALGIITLAVLGVARAARTLSWFGKAAPYVATSCYSLTFFFHLIPGVTETATRLPVGAPWAASQEDPMLVKIIGSLFILTIIGVTWQMLRLRSMRRVPARGGQVAA